MSRCLKCNNDLTTFDTGSVCRQCKQAEDKITMLQMSDTKSAFEQWWKTIPDNKHLDFPEIFEAGYTACAEVKDKQIEQFESSQKAIISVQCDLINERDRALVEIAELVAENKRLRDKIVWDMESAAIEYGELEMETETIKRQLDATREQVKEAKELVKGLVYIVNNNAGIGGGIGDKAEAWLVARTLDGVPIVKEGGKWVG